MKRSSLAVILVVAMIIIIVGIDMAFFRHHFWERLMANVGIALIFVAFGLRFLR